MCRTLAGRYYILQFEIKKTLEILQCAAEHIQQQNLEFIIEKCSDDEFGLLCMIFEKMREKHLFDYNIYRKDRELCRSNNYSQLKESYEQIRLLAWGRFI